MSPFSINLFGKKEKQKQKGILGQKIFNHFSQNIFNPFSSFVNQKMD